LTPEEYISSGILERYVLGQLSPEEASTVEHVAARHPAIQKEILVIEERLKNNTDHSSPEVSSPLEKQDTPEKETKVVYVQKETSPFLKLLMAASVSLALISTYSAIYFKNKLAEAGTQILAMQQKSQALMNTVNGIKFSYEEKLDASNTYISILLDTNTTAIELKGLSASPNSKAIVLWNKQSKEVLIDVVKLPAPPADKQYQLWALKDGVPTDAGVFNLKDSTGFLQKMKSIEDAHAFVVTLEQKGGSLTPNQEALYIMGHI